MSKGKKNSGGIPGKKNSPDIQAVQPAFEPEKPLFRGTGLGGFGRDSNPARIDVKNGKLIRTRPLHYAAEGYGPEYLKPWKLEVRGKVLDICKRFPVYG